MSGILMRLASGAARWLPAPAKRALYRLGPFSEGLRAALNRAAPQGLQVVAVAGGGLRGAKLALDLQREKDYWLGTYEPQLQQALKDWVEPGTVVYDLGANIGYISLLAARAVGVEGRVCAFEALPANRERLQANLARNPEGEYVELVARAVAESSGTRRFRVHSSGGMGKLDAAAGRQSDYLEEIEVASISLDEFVYAEGHPAPDAVKIDVEGGEGLALQGAQRLLREQRPLLLIELHGPEAAAEVWAQLEAADYSIQRLGRNYPRVKALDELDWKNYLLARPQHG